MWDAIIGGFVVLIGIWLKALIEDAFRFKKERIKSQHAATRLVVELDRFLHKTAAVACDDGRYVGTDPDTGYDVTEIQEEHPDFIDPLSVEDWKLIDKEHLYAFYLIADKQRDAHSQMQFASEELVSDPDAEEWWDARRIGYASLTEYVITVREKFEETYSVPTIGQRDWDPVTYMREKVAKRQAKA